MRVATDSDDFPAQVTVTLQEVQVRMSLLEPSRPAASIEFDSLSISNNGFEARVKNIQVVIGVIVAVFVGAVAHHVIQVTVDVVAFDDLGILRDTAEVEGIAFALVD